MSVAEADDTALFRALFETAPDATIVVDRAGRIVLANAQAERLFGYDDGSLAGRTVEALLPEALRVGHVAHRSRFMDNPRLRPMGAGFELTGMRRDGTEFPVEISLSPVHSGENPLFAASIRDTSETQRARQALARATYDTFLGQAGRLGLESRDDETLLQRMTQIIATALPVDAVVAIVAVPPREDYQVRVNIGAPPGLVDVLPSLFVGEHALLPRAQGRGPLTLDDAEEAMRLGGLRAAVADAGFADAAFVALSGRYKPIGALIAFAREARTFDRDHLHFLRSVANLSSSALQRSRSEEQLAHAQRLDAIGQLTGGVAHDFNNLLTVISGNIQLLEIEGVTEREHIIQSALRAVQNGAALTRKLLAFARRQPLSPRTIATEAWLNELGTLLKRTIGELVTIAIECPQDVPCVYADPGELDAALVNLALNARDAMPRGGELAIDAAAVAVVGDDEIADLRAGTYVRIRVSDTGLGMAPDVIARAPEPFFTTKAAGKGSGLGLSMVHGFVRQSGGTMSIDSRLGYGTRVALYLPTATPVAATAVAPTKRQDSPGREVVLVVEDDPQVREIAVAFLRTLGYATHAASTAELALEVIRSNASVDLLFSDVVLGSGMSGLDLALRARQHHPRLPVLLTSGYNEYTVDARTPFALLRKPYTREDFAAAIRLALDTDVGRSRV